MRPRWSRFTPSLRSATVLAARDRRPRTASEAVLLPCEIGSRTCAPQNRGYSSNHGKSRLAWEYVVGPGGVPPHWIFNSTYCVQPANKCTPDALDNFRNCPTDHLISQWSKRVTSTDDARAFMGSPVITRLSAKRLMPTPFNVARDDNERLSPPRLIVFESSCPAFRSTVRGELLRAQYLATMQPPPQC